MRFHAELGAGHTTITGLLTPTGAVIALLRVGKDEEDLRDRLYQIFEKAAKDSGCDTIDVWADDDELDLYSGFGFNCVAGRDDENGLFWMRKYFKEDDV